MINRHKKNSRRKRSFIKVLAKFIGVFFTIGCLLIGGVILYYANDIPNISKLDNAIRSPSVEIQSYDGTTIGTFGDLYEDVVSIKSLPKHVIDAFIAIEDARFYRHFGVDFIGVARAIYQNYIARKFVQGGSTITQQLAKNILIGEGVVSYSDRTIGRKIKELILAFWLEYQFTKSEIIMMYMNRVYFGAGTYGIEAASRKYFNKHATEINTFEAAILAGILRAPARYNPSNHKNYAYDRAIVVLKQMEAQGYIKSAKDIEDRESKQAFSQTVDTKNSAQYFCRFAYEHAKKVLGTFTDDLIVVTTFNNRIQKIADESTSFYLKNEGSTYKFTQVSFICMDRNGAILAMIGGSDYSATQFNRVTQAQRFPGSAFKLFVYGAALEYGYQVYDQISDAPISIGNWHPSNYKWRTRGSVSLIDAFTYSVNSPCIRLAKSIGLRRVSQFAKKLGITNVSENDLSIALGTTPVTLKDITAAFAAFMDGYEVVPYCIVEIRKKDGTILYSREEPDPIDVLDSEVLNNCRDLLHSVVQRGSGRAAKVNDYVYGKTGSNGDTDAWFIGFYDPDDESKAKDALAFGVWIGNDSLHDKMAANSTGGRIPARIIARFLKNWFKSMATNGTQNIDGPTKSNLSNIQGENSPVDNTRPNDNPINMATTDKQEAVSIGTMLAELEDLD